MCCWFVVDRSRVMRSVPPAVAGGSKFRRVQLSNRDPPATAGGTEMTREDIVNNTLTEHSLLRTSFALFREIPDGEEELPK